MGWGEQDEDFGQSAARWACDPEVFQIYARKGWAFQQGLNAAAAGTGPRQRCFAVPVSLNFTQPHTHAMIRTEESARLTYHATNGCIRAFSVTLAAAVMASKKSL